MVTNVVTYIVYNHIMICHPSLFILTLLELLSYFLSAINYFNNRKNYNFLDCYWLKKLLFSTNSLAKLL